MKSNIIPLKICLITPFPPSKKGEAEYAYDYVNAFYENNIYHVNFYIITEKVYEKTERDAQVFSIPNAKVERIINSNSIISRNLSFLKIFLRVCQIRPHIVHVTYGPNTDYGGRIGEPLILLFLGLKVMRIPIIVTLHSVWLPRDVKNRVTELGHGGFIAKIAVAYFSFFTKVFTFLADKILILTTIEKSPIITAYASLYRLPENKIGEEPHGCKFNPISVDEEKEAKAKLTLGEDKKILLSFGFIRRDKGFEFLIKAFSKIANENCLLIIAGYPKLNEDKSYLFSLLKLSETLGVRDKIIFDIRYVPNDKLKEYIDAADIIIFPYLRNVGASGSLHYAIARGKPIVATEVGHMALMKNIIITVPPKDVLKLTNAISKLLTDKEFAEKIKIRELEYARTHDWSRVISLNLDVYRNIVKSKYLGKKC
jgi:glycosyltransferase involved in cell wall biosynthesis